MRPRDTQRMPSLLNAGILLKFILVRARKARKALRAGDAARAGEELDQLIMTTEDQLGRPRPPRAQPGKLGRVWNRLKRH